MKQCWMFSLVWIFVALAAGELHPAVQAPPAALYLEDLTWTELRDAIRSGKTTAILPIGGTEQSGPDIALGKHNARVKVLAGMVAQGLGNAIVAPVIAYVPEGALDPPGSHMRYPGTLTVPEEAFEKTLEYAARSLKLHGFRNIVMLGDHGSYQQMEKVVAARLNREWKGTPARVIALEEYYHASSSGFEQILKSRGYSEAEIGRHAGLSDTSLQMAVAPGMVRSARLGSAVPNQDGVEGDPRKSSSALGELGVDEIVSVTIAAIRNYTTQP